MSPTEHATPTEHIPIVERDPAAIRATLEEHDYAPEEVQAVLDLHAYAVRENLGLSALARRLRTTAGVVSQYFSGTYGASFSRRARKIQEFLLGEEKRALYGGIDTFAKTSIASALWKIFERTRYSKRIQVIQSEEQVGKSTAAREYTARNNHGRTVMVTCPVAETGACGAAFVRNLAGALGLSTSTPLSLMHHEIKEALGCCDLIIIDEAHMLKNWPDRAVRCFLDFVRIGLHEDGARGVVLMATNEDLMDLIQSFRKRARYNIGQLLGRMCNQVLELAADEIPLEDVQLFVERYYKPGKRTLGKLHECACREHQGHFGLIKDVLNRAWADAKVDGVPLTDALVEASLESTVAEIAGRKELYI